MNILYERYYDSIKHFIPGTSTAITKIVIGYPFETLKVRQQLEIKNKNKNILFKYYKGCSLPLVTSIIKRSIQLNIYESLKHNSTYTAGAISGITASIIMNPFNIIKVNLQSNKYNNILHVLSNYRTIQKGFYINIVRDTLFSAYYLGTYGYLKKNLPDTSFYYSCSSIVAGSTIWLFLMPFDYIRNNIQTNVSHKTLIRGVTKEPTKLWYGTKYMIIKSIPVNLVNMVIYEYLKELCI